MTEFRVIDLEHYKRKELFNVFKDHQLPVFSVVVNLDITLFKTIIKKHPKTASFGFFIPLSYLITLAMNEVTELRHRIVQEEIREYRQVSPGYTILREDETFAFCDSQFFAKFSDYAPHSQQMITQAKIAPDYRHQDKQHLFFMTTIPWFSFTSITHPFTTKYASIPVVSLGKYDWYGDRLMMPLGLQVHHALVDGIHVGKFITKLEEMLRSPASFFEH